MKDHRMAVKAEHLTYDGLECVNSRSGGYMLTRKMINTTNFQGLDYLPVNSQFITWGSDQFAKYFDASYRKQLREEQQADKELFDIVVDSTDMKFALVETDKGIPD
ncbi:MAG: hypothetical protein EZS28_007991 [Streblomastix strix]|uniref:Uncharacterized protein n=1 Tax=Streblomastix strix TaxID=222440 RepID=A0A5J4WPE0_9EUKA|nr:MAG: hypothetical protein EZS28_007991 [Streblomastix strix]